jgi:predicted nicotinamide N-methyase
MLALPYKKYIYRFDGTDFAICGKPLVLKRPADVRDASQASDGDTGIAVWDAAVFLAKFFESNARLISQRRVLELGCGLGLCGIAALHAGASSVIFTDLGYILETTRRNIRENCIADPSAQIIELDWFNPEQSSIDWSSVDIIIASDIIWLEHLIEPLVKTLLRATGPKTEIIISNQRRSEKVLTRFMESVAPYFIQYRNHTLTITSNCRNS